MACLATWLAAALDCIMLAIRQERRVGRSRLREGESLMILNLLAMQVALITPILIHPSFLMQELTGILIQVPLAI